MNKMFKIVRREFVTKVFTRGFLIGTLFGPIAILGFFFIPSLFEDYGEASTRVIHIVDQTDAQVAHSFGETLGDRLTSGAPGFVVTKIEAGHYQERMESIHASIESGALDALIVIPKNVLQGDTVKFMVRSSDEFAFIRNLRSRLDQHLGMLRLRQAGVDPEEVKLLTATTPFRAIEIGNGKSNARTPGQGIPAAIFFLMILYITTITYGTMVMRGVLEEKTSRILEVLLSSGNSFQLMMGKLLGIGSAGLVQYLVWISIPALGLMFSGDGGGFKMSYLSAIDADILIYFVLFFVLAYFQFSAMYAAVGAMCSSQEDAQAASAPVIFLIIIPFLVSISLGIQSPSAPLAKLFSVLPFFSPMMMFTRVVLSSPGTGEILLAVSVNLVTIVLLIWVAAKIYRVGVLMYGKRATIPEALRWLRHS